MQVVHELRCFCDFMLVSWGQSLSLSTVTISEVCVLLGDDVRNSVLSFPGQDNASSLRNNVSMSGVHQMLVLHFNFVKNEHIKIFTHTGGES